MTFQSSKLIFLQAYIPFYLYIYFLKFYFIFTVKTTCQEMVLSKLWHLKFSVYNWQHLSFLLFYEASVMRQKLSLFTLPVIRISLANSCQRQMKVHKSWCSCWQPLCIKQQSLHGSTVSMWLKKGSLCVPRMKAALPISVIPNYTGWLTPVKKWSTYIIIHVLTSRPSPLLDSLLLTWPVSKRRGEKIRD